MAHTVKLFSWIVSLDGHDSTELRMMLNVPAATPGATHDASGIISFAPQGIANNGVALNLPYYVVTRARSKADARLRQGESGDEGGPAKQSSVRVDNRTGAISGSDDFYVWGLKNPKTGTLSAAYEPRAVSVQSFPVFATDNLLVLAVNKYGRFSNPAAGEYHIYLDVNGDGIYDFVLFLGDVGSMTTGVGNGQIATFLLNIAKGTVTAQLPADAPTDGSMVLMPVLSSHLGITAQNPRLSYAVQAFDDTGAGEAVTGVASFKDLPPRSRIRCS